MRQINYKTYKKPSDYMKLEVGQNRIKILTEGVMCYEHSMMMGKKFIPLGVCSERADCEQCKKGNLPKLRYKWVAYSITTKETQLLAVGPEIGDEICRIGKEAESNIFEVMIRKELSGGRFRSTVTRVQSNNIDLETLKRIKQRSDYLSVKYLSI